MFLLMIPITLLCGVVCLYFSPTALRYLSAWAQARALAIEFQQRTEVKLLKRMGIYQSVLNTPTISESASVVQYETEQ